MLASWLFAGPNPRRYQGTDVGHDAKDPLESLTDASNNTSVGWRSDDDLITANNCTFVGSQAGSGVTTGSDNVVVGQGSGSAIGTGTNDIYLGTGVNGGSDEVRFIRIGDPVYRL